MPVPAAVSSAAAFCAQSDGASNNPAIIASGSTAFHHPIFSVCIRMPSCMVWNRLRHDMGMNRTSVSVVRHSAPSALKSPRQAARSKPQQSALSTCAARMPASKVGGHPALNSGRTPEPGSTAELSLAESGKALSKVTGEFYRPQTAQVCYLTGGRLERIQPNDLAGWRGGVPPHRDFTLPSPRLRRTAPGASTRLPTRSKRCRKAAC